LNGTHVREFAAQAFVVLRGGGKPDSVIRRLRGPLMQDQNELRSDIDREAAEKSPHIRRERRERFNHELVGHLHLLDPTR
jgi:hypothetical protein